MSRTSRRGAPPIECPLASLGRNSLPLDATHTYHHPLSSSPLNPQVYQIAARKTPLLNDGNSGCGGGSSDEMYSSTTSTHLDAKDSADDTNSPPDFSTSTTKVSKNNPNDLRPAAYRHHRGYTVAGAVVTDTTRPSSYHHRTNVVARNNPSTVAAATHNDQYYFEEDDKIDHSSIYDESPVDRQATTERYYLEDSLCSYVVRRQAPTSGGEGSRGSDSCYRHRMSSPSETSGSDRYNHHRRSGAAANIRQPILSSAASYSSASATHYPSCLMSATVASNSITTNTIDGLLLTSLDRFSPSLDQGYATLASPSPSGGIGLAGHQTPGPWNHHRSASRSIGSTTVFDLLSDEAVLKIFMWLDSCELCTVARVSRRFESLVWRPVLWKHIKLRGNSISFRFITIRSTIQTLLTIFYS